MNKKTSIILISTIILILIFTLIGIRRDDNQQNTNTYNSVTEALQAGVDATMKIYNVTSKNDEYNQPIFKYKDKEDTYFVNKVILKGDGDISYSENLYVIKVKPKDKKYMFEQASSLFTVKQVDEGGEVMHPTWTIPIKKKLTFIVGKVENPQQQNVYADDEKVRVYKDGFFVYVYKGKGEPPELIFEP